MGEGGGWVGFHKKRRGFSHAEKRGVKGKMEKRRMEEDKLRI